MLPVSSHWVCRSYFLHTLLPIFSYFLCLFHTVFLISLFSFALHSCSTTCFNTGHIGDVCYIVSDISCYEVKFGSFMTCCTSCQAENCDVFFQLTPSASQQGWPFIPLIQNASTSRTTCKPQPQILCSVHKGSPGRAILPPNVQNSLTSTYHKTAINLSWQLDQKF